MTLDGLMDEMKQVYVRAASGPLRDRGWRVVNERAGRDLQSLLRQDANLRRIDYSFYVVVDSDGGESFNARSMQAAQDSWIHSLRSPPADSLEVSGQVRRRGTGARATVEVTAIRRTPTSLVVARGSSRDGGGGERVREEGSRASVRGGAIDADALARLSTAVRSTSGSRSASANLTDEEAGR
jgi:hypothetical protein